ncbi:hypothetical protein AZF37_07210 [endosymbiont 'TC1' of Trimyema compressum]|uniref:WxL protein peptidoglycan domain-containing protein n=1 Tax=endosymbiont 'TC1' of Trimyema compressum TaxID=243899 RepID=UPI0007F0B505|nr:DUF916 domain-containing protein [endosymbiont 'TC1' of Trimyema compressum]AMP20977.1 hypothetical protein AZF37_07210 [endosymbiont 'TC1' of Trimyema compressum]
MEAVLPSNQRNSKVSYFDLNISPNFEQTLELKIHNKTNKTIYLECHVTDAWTTMNGVVDYSMSDCKKDSTQNARYQIF